MTNIKKNAANTSKAMYEHCFNGAELPSGKSYRDLADRLDRLEVLIRRRENAGLAV